MNKIQTVLLETFKSLLQVFEQYGIPYFTGGGTTLGAIRHNGFIPWDDDIDIYVPRKDYDRLLSLRNEINNDSFKLMCIYDYPYHYPHSRYYNLQYKLSSCSDALFHQGPFVDIIPLDEAEGTTIKTKWLEWKYIKSAKRCRRCIYHADWSRIFEQVGKRDFFGAAYNIYRRILYPHKLYKRYLQDFIKAEQKIRQTKGPYNFCYFHVYPMHKEMFAKRVFEGFILVPFEDIKVRVPIGYDEYLTQVFDDYMQLPPLEQRTRHCDEASFMKCE